MARNMEARISRQLQNLPPPPPWVQEIQKARPDLFLCHMQTDELEALDNMQHGPSLDDATGIREYSQLEPVIDNPEVQEILMTIFNDLSDDGELEPALEAEYQEAKKISLPYRETPIEKTKAVDDLEETGRNGDNKFAFLPKNLIFFLWDLRGGPENITFNPETGLPEFFFKAIRNVISAPINAINKITGTKIGSETLRIGGTLIGALYGGPMGAGLGNAAASWATGKSPIDSLWSGAKNYGLASGIQAAGNAAGLSPQGAMFGGQGYGFEGKLGASLPSWAGGNAQATTTAAESLAPAATGGAKTTVAATNATNAAKEGAKGLGFWNTIGEIAGHKAFLPATMAASTALSYLGQKQTDKKQRQKDLEKEEKFQRNQERLGVYDPLVKKRMSYRQNPLYEENRASGRYDQPMYLYEEQPFKKGGKIKKPKRYNHGGHVLNSASEGKLIEGPGDGQADKIQTHIPADSYIIDATTVAHLGNGSSENGGERIKEAFTILKNKTPPDLINHLEKYFNTNSPQTPVYLSNREWGEGPVGIAVTGYHKGAKTIDQMIKQGAKTMKSMVHAVRKDKARNGLGLPPPAKHPLEYMKLNGK